MKIGFDKNHTIPRDITAKKVVYDSGDHYNPAINCKTYLFSTDPIPTTDIRKLPTYVRKDPNFIDYTGKFFGNFTVIGIFSLNKFNKWVVRCICGCYEIRTTRTIKNATKFHEMRCQSCMDLERLRNKDYFSKNGRYPWQNEKERKQADKEKI